MRRLFVALELGPAMTDVAMNAIETLRPTAPDAKWARRDALHLTLVFLGAVPDDSVGDVANAVAVGASSSPRLRLRLSGAGSFGPGARPRVLWLGFEGDLDRLSELQRDLTDLLIPEADREARPYRPHLTLARARGTGGDPALANAVEPLASVASDEVTLREIVLFQSELSPSGAKHTVVARHPLG